MEVSTHVAGRYRIDARIGGGGMADVFEARDQALDRDVAIKLLRGIDDPAAARRFAEEIRLTARLNHPNVVRLFDAGEHEGSPFLVLERVTGGTLAQAMADGPLAPERVAGIGRQIAAALEHAHGEGIVHRDVKPSNILLTADETVRLADFGIALTATATRLTVAGSVAGSAGYVSPEQVLGTGAGAASDVYALGLVLLECLTGAPPWSGSTVEVALARITADPPIPEAVPPPWHGLLTAMTARRPEDRPAMGPVAAALADLAAGRPTLQFPAPAPAPRRMRMPVAALGALLLLAAGGLMMANPPAAGPTIASARAVTPDGVIAASVIGGAAVPQPSAGAQATATQEPAATAGPRDRRATDGQSATGGSASTTTNVPVTTPRVAAPAPPPAPAGATPREVPQRTTTPREPDDNVAEDTDEADDGKDDEDAEGTGDSVDKTPRGNDRANAAKARRPGDSVPTKSQEARGPAD